MGKKKSKGGGGGGDGPAVDRPPPEETVKDETLEQLEARHLREMTEVLAVTATFGKGKKDKDRAMRMEGEVRDRHYAETAAWEELNGEVPDNAGGPPEAPSSDESEDEAAQRAAPLVEAVGRVRVSGGEEDGGRGGGMTKAMKRRLKKEAEEKEREARIEEEKANMGPSNRDHEEAALRRLLHPMGLRVKEIKADGHCMYRSVEDQLAQKPAGGFRGSAPGPDDYASLRRRCASVMRTNEWDYRPFLGGCHEDSPAHNAAWAKYCDDVEDSAAWGGQMELGALAKAVGRCIKVYSAHMPVVVMGEEFQAQGEPLVVCYQQHAFGLGEHYNSVVDA